MRPCCKVFSYNTYGKDDSNYAEPIRSSHPVSVPEATCPAYSYSVRAMTFSWNVYMANLLTVLTVLKRLCPCISEFEAAQVRPDGAGHRPEPTCYVRNRTTNCFEPELSCLDSRTLSSPCRAPWVLNSLPKLRSLPLL